MDAETLAALQAHIDRLPIFQRIDLAMIGHLLALVDAGIGVLRAENTLELDAPPNDTEPLIVCKMRLLKLGRQVMVGEADSVYVGEELEAIRAYIHEQR